MALSRLDIYIIFYLISFQLFIKVGPIYFLIVGLIACFLALLMYFGLRMSSNVAPEVAGISGGRDNSRVGISRGRISRG